MGKKHKGKRGGGGKGPAKAPPPTTTSANQPSEETNEIGVDEQPNLVVPLSSDASQDGNSIQVQANRDEKQVEGNISPPGECIAVKLALPEKLAECQDEVVVAVPSEAELNSSVQAPQEQSLKVVEKQEETNAGPQTLSRRQRKKMNKERGEQESQKTINTEDPKKEADSVKEALKTESKDTKEEEKTKSVDPVKEAMKNEPKEERDDNKPITMKSADSVKALKTESKDKKNEKEPKNIKSADSVKEVLKTESKDKKEEIESNTIKLAEKDSKDNTKSATEITTIKGSPEKGENAKNSEPQEKIKDPLKNSQAPQPVKRDQEQEPNIKQKKAPNANKSNEQNSGETPSNENCPDKSEAKVDTVEVTRDDQPPVENNTTKPVKEHPKKASAKQKSNDNSKKNANKKCPYEHKQPPEKIHQPLIEDQGKPPIITGMILETGNSEIDQKKEMNPESVTEVVVTKTQPENLENKTTSIENSPPVVGSAENKQNPELVEEAKDDSSSELREVEIDLKKDPVEESSALPQSTVEFIVQSMTDSTTSDIAVVVEKSLENISSVPDEEMMKLFKIVSKDFEKSPEPTTKEKFQNLNEPIAQAGAALANLIDAVGKTESKIKEMVEETKKQQKSTNNSKKSKSKTPEKAKDLTINPSPQDNTDILSDAIIVESPQPSETDPKSAKAKTKQSTDPKNVQRSDFVLSAEQQMDKAKSLLNNKTNAKAPRDNKTEQLPNQQQQPPNQQPKKTKKPVVPPRPESTKTKGQNQVTTKALPASQTTANWDEDSDEEDYIEYKFSSRKVFLHNVCHVCQKNSALLCPQCSMISYCSEQHCLEDLTAHKDYCTVIQEVAKKRGGHIYNNAKILDANDFRNLRVHTLNICSTSLKRPLQPFEKEMLLFPRLCLKSDCKNWKPAEIVDCSTCNQVSYCKDHPEHLPQDHSNWCRAFTLYQRLNISNRIEPPMPSAILSQKIVLPTGMDALLKGLYGESFKDECVKALVTQVATGPLTALNAMQVCKLAPPETFVVHLIGAELQFEGDCLNKWEAFFLHLVPEITELRVVFIGPELNVENLPVEILSRIRMCRNCRQSARNVKFDFQNRTLYHDYAKSPLFTKPNLICYFNPGLYRMTGFNGLDTWPETVKASLQYNCPIVVTSYSALESPMDLAQMQRLATEAGKTLEIIEKSTINPFASQRPERNFISDHDLPMIFKNFYFFVVNC